ncbi:MAG: transcription termination factor NusA, partial [Myxococcales bacterium]|nr:transcription termination factor NusA [Myxococcales bacterium]
MEDTINLSAVLDQVCAEKNISRDVLIETVEQAVATAAKKVFEDREIEATFDPETGHVNLFQVLYVVDKVQSKGREIAQAAAQRAGIEAELGDELLFQIFYLDSDKKRAEQQAKDY